MRSKSLNHCTFSGCHAVVETSRVQNVLHLTQSPLVKQPVILKQTAFSLKTLRPCSCQFRDSRPCPWCWISSVSLLLGYLQQKTISLTRRYLGWKKKYNSEEQNFRAVAIFLDNGLFNETVGGFQHNGPSEQQVIAVWWDSTCASVTKILRLPRSLIQLDSSVNRTHV